MTGTAIDLSGTEILPLSFGQEQLWFLEQLAPGMPTYNVAVLYQIRGPVDEAALDRSLVRVVSRHDILRARFQVADGVAHQVIADPPLVALTVDDLTGVGEADRETAALTAATAEARHPFDLSAGPLYRFRLFRIADDHRLLSAVVHHIVCDGWSFNVIAAEISATYNAIVAGRPLPADPPHNQYRDFVDAQRTAFSGGTFDSQLEYWGKRLVGLPTLDLPADRPRPALAGHAGERLDVRYPDELNDALRDLARTRGVSLSMVVTAALGVVLSRYTGEEDVPIGTTALGRLDPRFEQLVGLFVNIVVLRLDLSGDPTFGQLLSQVRDTSLDAYDNQTIPFERVVDRLGVARDPSRNPLFGVCVQVLDSRTGGGSLHLPGAGVSLVDQSTGRSRFDLSLTFIESEHGLRLSVEYSTDLFDRWRIEQLAAHVGRVLAAAAADASTPVSAINLLNEAERVQLHAFGRGPHDELCEDPVHVTVAQRAAAAPESTAVVFEGQRLSYGELNRRADVLARHLRRSHAIGHEEIVAVALDRGLEVLVAFLGVLKAGSAFVILDTEHPVNRLGFILDDAGARVVLTLSDLLPRLPEPGERTYVCLDRDWDAIETEPATETEVPDQVSSRDSLVYVLYTSGSTGKPKGVLIEHRALVSYLTSFVEMFDLGPGDRILQFASLAFDLAQAEIFSALCAGATLVFARKDTLLSPDALASLLRDEHVTYLGAPPSMLALLQPEPYPDLRNVLVGGEACPAQLVNRWNLPGRKFVNGYGPTEATIGATMYAVPQREWHSSPPIGGPLQHRRLYVVDQRNALVPLGVPGELLIGGDEGLARGYLNRPDLNAAKFVQDPFWPAGRVYRSGDLVRWNPDGQLEFLGRIDTQVKLRGLRIELEEIEAVLQAYPAVRQAAVALRQDAADQQVLAAYITLSSEETPSVAELRRHLSEHVPPYMIPGAWTVLDALPLSVAGKLDRRALPAPTLFVDDAREVVAPRTRAEQHVAAAFSEVLGLPADQVGCDDDFFELGGSSLQAMRVISRLNHAFSVDLGVRALYSSPRLSDIAEHLEALATEPPVEPNTPPSAPATTPTVAERIATMFAEVLPHARRVSVSDSLFTIGGQERHASRVLEEIDRRLGVSISARDLFTPSMLAAAVEARRAAEQRASWSLLVPLVENRSGSLPPLFLVPGASGSASVYAGFARELGSQRSVVGLEAPGVERGRDPLDRVESLAAEFVAALRERQPQGTYHLLGWSMGGLVAFEMARQLQAAGETVAFLAVLDTQLPTGDPVPDDRDIVSRFVQDLAAEAGRPSPDRGSVEEHMLRADGFEELFELLRSTVLPPEIGSGQVRRRMAVFRASSHAAYSYRPTPGYQGRIIVARTAGAPTPAADWSDLAAEVLERHVRGDHYSLWAPEHRPALVSAVDELLSALG